MQACVADEDMMFPGFIIISEVLHVRISYSLWEGQMPSFGAFG